MPGITSYYFFTYVTGILAEGFIHPGDFPVPVRDYQHGFALLHDFFMYPDLFQLADPLFDIPADTNDAAIFQQGQGDFLINRLPVFILPYSFPFQFLCFNSNGKTS